MDNPGFVDEENIPLVHEGDYNDCNTPDTSILQKTQILTGSLLTFTDPNTTKTKSTLQLQQKVKQDKIIAMYSHLNVTDILDLINLDQFKITTDTKNKAAVFELYNGDK